MTYLTYTYHLLGVGKTQCLVVWGLLSALADQVICGYLVISGLSGHPLLSSCLGGSWPRWNFLCSNLLGVTSATTIQLLLKWRQRTALQYLPFMWFLLFFERHWRERRADNAFLQLWFFWYLSAFSSNTNLNEPAFGKVSCWILKFFSRCFQKVTNSLICLKWKFECIVSLFKPMWPSARFHMLDKLADSWSCYLTLQWNFSILKIAQGRRCFNSFYLQHFSGVFCFAGALIHSFKAVCGNLCMQGWRAGLWWVPWNWGQQREMPGKFKVLD